MRSVAEKGREPPMEPGQPAKHGPKSETARNGRSSLRGTSSKNGRTTVEISDGFVYFAEDLQWQFC